MQQITWSFCQDNTNKILADGLDNLVNSTKRKPTKINFLGSGNYLFSDDEFPLLIGESENISNRMREKINPKIKFENYLRKRELISVKNLFVRYIPTTLGRKEIETFGEVNLSPPLNLNLNNHYKKTKFKNSIDIWNQIQSEQILLLDQGAKKVLRQLFSPWGEITVTSTPGIFLIRKDTKIIYVGESFDLEFSFTVISRSTFNSKLRRLIGTNIFGFELKDKYGTKKRCFNDEEEKIVTDYIQKTSAIFHVVNFGRYELKEFFIKKYEPLLN